MHGGKAFLLFTRRPDLRASARTAPPIMMPPPARSMPLAVSLSHPPTLPRPAAAHAIKTSRTTCEGRRQVVTFDTTHTDNIICEELLLLPFPHSTAAIATAAASTTSTAPAAGAPTVGALTVTPPYVPLEHLERAVAQLCTDDRGEGDRSVGDRSVAVLGDRSAGGGDALSLSVPGSPAGSSRGSVKRGAPDSTEGHYTGTSDGYTRWEDSEEGQWFQKLALSFQANPAVRPHR